MHIPVGIFSFFFFFSCDTQQLHGKKNVLNHLLPRLNTLLRTHYPTLVANQNSGQPQASHCYREGAENQYSSPNSQIDFEVHPIVPIVLIVQLMSRIQVLPKFVYQVMD
jgi:hypothetical protein